MTGEHLGNGLSGNGLSGNGLRPLLQGRVVPLVSQTGLCRVVSLWAATPGEWGGCVVAATSLFAAYGHFHNQWSNPVLAAISAYFLLSIIPYAVVSNFIQHRIHLITHSLLVSMIARFFVQYLYNLTMFFLFLWWGVVSTSAVANVGGPFVGAALVTFTSAGLQMAGLRFASLGVGGARVNTVAAVVATVLATAAAIAGYPVIKTGLYAIGGALGALLLAYFLFADLQQWRRARIGPDLDPLRAVARRTVLTSRQ